MGASVIWAYIELFGHPHLKQAVFVDQAPLQVSLGLLETVLQMASRKIPCLHYEAGVLPRTTVQLIFAGQHCLNPVSLPVRGGLVSKILRSTQSTATCACTLLEHWLLSADYCPM